MAGVLAHPSKVKSGDVPPDVRLIAIMGPTGSGKSSFINHLLAPGSEKAEVGHGLKSCTSDVKAMPFELNGWKGSIIDTPGFDDTNLTDTDVLKRISAWMELSYRGGVRITGIIYLRDITESRMKGSSIRNLAMFRELCGTDSLSNVVFVTTKWDLASAKTAETRETEFKETYISTELANNAQLARHDNSAKSATDVVGKILGHQAIALKLQKQLVDEGLDLKDTGAGVAVSAEIEKLRQVHAEELEALRVLFEAKSTKENAALKKEIEAKQAETTKKLKKLTIDKNALETDHSREILEYRKRLQEVADTTGQTTSDVLKQGLTTGVMELPQLLLKEWQDWKAEQAKDRAAERAAQQKKEERESVSEKKRLETEQLRMTIKKDTAREMQVAALTKELEVQKGLQSRESQQSNEALNNLVPIMDLLALPIKSLTKALS